MANQRIYVNLIFFPLKVQALVESWGPEGPLEDLLNRSLDTPDWSLEQLWEVAAYYHVHNQFEKSLRYYYRLLEWTEHEPQAHGEVMGAVGHVLLASQEIEDAKKALKWAIHKAPQARRAHYFLAKCLEYERQFAQAIGALQRFLQAYPEPDMLAAEASCLQAMLYDRLGQPEAARQVYLDAAQRLKSWGFVQQAQNYLPLLPFQSLSPLEPDAEWLSYSVFLGPELAEWYPYRGVYTDTDLKPLLEASGQRLAPAVAQSLIENPLPLMKNPDYTGQRIVIVGDFSAREALPYQDFVIELARQHGVTLVSIGDAPAILRQEEWMAIYPVSNSLPHLRTAVSSQQPELLLYLDVGPRSPNSYALATQQLAPVQAVLGTYPVTSGLSTLQYFLSFDWLEPPEAEAHYTEQLVRLQGMPLKNSWLPDHFIPREAFRLPTERRTYLCPVPVSSQHLAFQEILAEILQLDPEAQILMPGYISSDVDQLCYEHFKTHYPDLIDRFFFLPPVNEISLLSLVREADVILDPIHMGLTHSLWRLIALGTPVVSWTAPYARGRYATGLYQQLGLNESLVSQLSDYASTAVALAKDPSRKAHFRETIAQQKTQLFQFQQYMDDFNAFLARAMPAKV